MYVMLKHLDEMVLDEILCLHSYIWEAANKVEACSSDFNF